MSNINRAEVHNTTWSGPWAIPQAGNVTVTQAGNLITLNIPNIEAISSVSAPINMVSPLITRFRPTNNVWNHTKVRDDSLSNNSDGSVLIRPDGTITIYGDENASNFTGGGVNTGFIAFSVTYLSAIVPGFDNQI